MGVLGAAGGTGSVVLETPRLTLVLTAYSGRSLVKYREFQTILGVGCNK